MNYTCHACGHRARSAIAEARHRHNFPVLCKRNKRFLKWAKERDNESMKAKLEALPVGRLFVPVWVIADNMHKALFRKLEAPYLRGCCLAGSSAVVSFELNDDLPAHRYTLHDEWIANKLRIDVPTEEQQVQFEMLLAHGLTKRAFEVVGFTLEVTDV